MTTTATTRKVKCPDCGKGVRVPADADATEAAVCPACGARFEVPPPPLLGPMVYTGGTPVTVEEPATYDAAGDDPDAPLMLLSEAVAGAAPVMQVAAPMPA